MEDCGIVTCLMTYDEAMKRLEQLMQQLESGEALSMTEYKQKAGEVRELARFCREQLAGMAQETEEKA